MIETQVITITVEQAKCHDTCVDVSTEDHHANVNPVAFTEPVKWRIDCDTCGTCVRILPTQEVAIEKAKRHVLLTTGEFYELRDKGWV